MATPYAERRPGAFAGEKNDCSVLSLMETTGRTYEECHAALKASGRKNGRGCYSDQVIEAARRLGFSPKVRYVRRVSMKTVHNHCRIGVPAVVFCTSHFAGWNGQQISDWSTDTRRKVRRIIDIFPKGAA